MKLIRKSILILVIFISFIFGNAKSKTKKTLNLNEEAIDSDLIFLEKLYTLDTSIKEESLKNQNSEKSGFEEFDHPITKVSKKEDSSSLDHCDQDALKDEHEDIFTVGDNAQDDFLDVEKDNFKDEKNKKNENNTKEVNSNFLELGAKTITSTNDNDFFKNKLDEINKFEMFLLNQEKQLEQKSRELLEKTASFLK